MSNSLFFVLCLSLFCFFFWTPNATVLLGMCKLRKTMTMIHLDEQPFCPSVAANQHVLHPAVPKVIFVFIH